ncbi:MAG: hypothetical protein ACQZ3N_02185 [cyanobacterium endosymbiont of Rhopalodia yunnanensis]
MNSMIITPVKSSTVFPATSISIGHQSDNDDKNTCYSCVDDHNIPPCAGFSQDYSCLPNLGSSQQT